jgi:hypothetical protein
MTDGDGTDAGRGTGSVPASGRSASGAKGPDELRRQIEGTRARLGDTVGELAGKTDLKGRAKVRAEDLRDRAGALTVQLRSTTAQAGQTVRAGLRHRTPVLLASAGVGAGAVVAVGVLRRHRGHR